MLELHDLLMQTKFQRQPLSRRLSIGTVDGPHLAHRFAANVTLFPRRQHHTTEIFPSHQACQGSAMQFTDKVIAVPALTPSQMPTIQSEREVDVPVMMR